MASGENEVITSEGEIAFEEMASEIGIEIMFLTFFYMPYRKEIGKDEEDDDDLTLQDVLAFKQYLLGGGDHWKKVLLGASRIFVNMNGSGVTFQMDDGSSMTENDFQERCERLKAWIGRNGGDTKYSGCYIATAVYGSYDCPQVWTLRRYRDERLQTNLFGKTFVKAYYAISPTLVRRFGQQTWFRKLFKLGLDRFVGKLNSQGIEDSAYCD